MALSKDEIEHIAHLARLEVSQDEIADYVNKLSSIIDLVAHLGTVDTANVLPMAHPLDMGQRLRADEVTETDDRGLYQQNSESVAKGFYKVPKVIE